MNPGRARGSAQALLLAVVVLTLAGCAGRSAYREGMDLYATGRHEAALARLDEARRAAPDNPVFRMSYENARKRIVGRLLTDAQRATQEGRFDAAQLQYARAERLLAGTPVDAASNAAVAAGQVALATARRHADQIREARARLRADQLDAAGELLAGVLRENPAQADALALRRELEARTETEKALPAVLSKAFRTPVTLEFRDASLAQVLEALSRHGGLNFVIDRDVPANLLLTVFLRDVSLADALDVILSTNQLRRRVLTGSTLLIYPDTTAKQNDHQELVVKNIFLTNATATQVATMLKTILKMRNVHADDRLNLLILRDTPALIRLAERLVATEDVDEPEVMLEVAIVEMTRSALENLGIQWPNQLSLAPLSASGSRTALTWQDLRDLDSAHIGVTVPPLTLNLQDEAGATNLLANPRIRTHNREKAQIRIGDRVPVITTTATSTGFLSENVQYIDVGLKLEVEPVIYPGDEVAIRLALDVSSVAREIVSPSGTVSYQIGGRSAATMLRLKNGETQILGGLINDEDRRTANNFPGLSRLPVLGRLFGSRSDNNQKTELVLSITPRVVRSLAPPPGVPGEFWSGTENDPRLRATPVPGESGATRPRLYWQGPAQVRRGDTFTATLAATGVDAVRQLPLQIKYDRALFDLVDVVAGPLQGQDDALAAVSRRLEGEYGMIYLEHGRRASAEPSAGPSADTTAPATSAPAAAVDAETTLAQVRLRARRAGAQGRITVLATDPIGRAGTVLPQTGPASLSVEVLP